MALNNAADCMLSSIRFSDISAKVREKFLQIVVDHFIALHVAQMADVDDEEHVRDKPGKRKSGGVKYEGDPQFVLPLMYVSNIYETLVNEVDARFGGKTIGVDFEAMGGLYWKLAKKFPETGPLAFKRRELAVPVETRTKFPELVVQEEKGVRIVVVNGLNIVEKPDTLSIDDAEWFKRVTGRSEVSISAHDYKFYSPRHIYQRVVSKSLLSATELPNEFGLCFSINENDTNIVAYEINSVPQKNLQTEQLLPLMKNCREPTQVSTTNEKYKNSKDLSASQCKSKQTLPRIKDKDPKNATNLKDIFNSCDEPQVEDKADLAILQYFFKKAGEDHRLKSYRMAPGTDIVTDLVISDHKSLALLRAYPHVVIIDVISKENRYKIPFLKVLGYTPSGKNFNVACAFISAEREDNYVWVLKCIKGMCETVGRTPRAIVTMTDPDQVLFSAVKEAFPHTKHLLSRPHIYKCIEGRCYEDMCAYSTATLFVDACKYLFESKTEDVYETRLAFVERIGRASKG